jgi:hypothetical protein
VPDQSSLCALDSDDPRHGTTNGYTNLGCRCYECRSAWREYVREKNHRLGRHRPWSEYLADVTTVRDSELRCVRCQNWLPDVAFAARRTNEHRRGRHEWCTACCTENRRQLRAQMSEDERERTRAYDRQRKAAKRRAAA